VSPRCYTCGKFDGHLPGCPSASSPRPKDSDARSTRQILADMNGEDDDLAVLAGAPLPAVSIHAQPPASSEDMQWRFARLVNVAQRGVDALYMAEHLVTKLGGGTASADDLRLAGAELSAAIKDLCLSGTGTETFKATDVLALANVADRYSRPSLLPFDRKLHDPIDIAPGSVISLSVHALIPFRVVRLFSQTDSEGDLFITRIIFGVNVVGTASFGLLPVEAFAVDRSPPPNVCFKPVLNVGQPCEIMIENRGTRSRRGHLWFEGIALR